MKTREWVSDADEAAFKVKCTLCGAMPMKPCWNKHEGEFKNRVHMARIENYERIKARHETSKVDV